MSNKYTDEQYEALLAETQGLETIAYKAYRLARDYGGRDCNDCGEQGCDFCDRLNEIRFSLD
jgi:hypothetical protein